ncbi:MAG TPA: response regulator transcription factor [Candidatus Acidoferrum sp.]|nr:response regulator transcription factor [Candidatus Acidoferrum sp.]
MKGVMVTVALADDHVVVRQGLRLLLESDPEFVVVGEAADGIEALELVKSRKPKVLIADLMMPGLDGLEITRRVSRLKLDTRVVILTMYGDEVYLLDALGSGAAGFVVKESCGADLFQAIRDVVAGRRYLSPLLSEASTRRYLQKFQTALLKLSDTLTTRERKVLQLVLEGASSCDIGARLKITLRTVESDLARFVEKLGLNPRQDSIRHTVKRRVRPRGRTKFIKKK